MKVAVVLIYENETRYGGVRYSTDPDNIFVSKSVYLRKEVLPHPIPRRLVITVEAKE